MAQLKIVSKKKSSAQQTSALPNADKTTDKKEPNEMLTDMLHKLGLDELKEKFPHSKMETWRKLDPQKLLAVMYNTFSQGWQPLPPTWKAVEQGVPATTEDHRSEHFMKTMAEWKESDETFYKKIEKLIDSETFRWSEEKTFFAELAVNLCPLANVYVLRIPRNTHWSNAIHILWKNIQNLHYMFLDRMLVYVEEGASATVYIEKFSEGFGISTEKIFVEHNARLNIHHLRREGVGAGKDENSAWVVQQKFYLSEHSHVCQGVYSAGGKLGKFFAEAELEKDAVFESYGLHVGDHSHVDHDFEVFHQGSRSLSSVHFRMALLDKAYGIFRANIHIPKPSIACKAMQENKNLIMGKNSKADAIPQLEILTEEVEASHGSATGELDEEELFYLMSRGLDEKQAQQLLLTGFFENIMQMALGETQGSEGFQNPFLHDIWCAIQDRLHINFERYHLNSEEDNAL